MIKDEVIEIMDKKLYWLKKVVQESPYDSRAKKKLEFAIQDKELYILTKDFALEDWKKIHTEQYFLERDKVRGFNQAETEFLRKQFLKNHIEQQ